MPLERSLKNLAKKGDLAREYVKNKIVEAFGGDFVGIADKKIYVKARDGENGEEMQFAISMTMPKTPLETAGSSTPDLSTGVFSSVPASTPVEMDPADKAKVEELKKRLGIID